MEYEEIIRNFVAENLKKMEHNNMAMKSNDGMTAYGTNSYVDVMMMLYSLPITAEVKRHVGQRLMEETTEPALAAVFASMDDMSKLKDGWAGDGTYAISQKVLDNLKSVLLISGNADWKDWMVGPDVNATIGLQSRTTRALISLGADEFSYFVRKNGKCIGDSRVKFTPETFLSIMNKLAR